LSRWFAHLLWFSALIGPGFVHAQLPSGVVEIHEAWFLKSDAAEFPAQDAGWQRQPLPDSWRESRPGAQGYGWYRADFELPGPVSGVHAIYISLVNSAYAVHINGVQVGNSGGMEGAIGRNGGFPQWVTVPPEILRTGTNTFALRLRVAANLRGGLTPPVIGPKAAVEALHGRDELWRTIVPRALNTATLALGMLSLLLWSRHRSEAAYGWFGGFLALTSVWALRNFHHSMTLPDISSRAWEVFVLSGHGIARLFLLMFVLRYIGQRRPTLEKVVLWAAALMAPVLYAAGEAAMSAVRIPFYSATALPMWYSIWLLARYSAWRSEPAPALILAALVGCECLALHDWLIAINQLPFGTLQWQGYGVALLMTAMTVALAGRYFAAFATARTLNLELEQRVAQKTRELHAQLLKSAAYERAAALEEERRRLMRDMHDGIGSQLITTATAVERGALPPEQVAALLRDCIADLRLVIDSLEPGHGDLALALAGLRYRLEPRLRSAGLESRWELEGLGDIVLAPTDVLQVMRIVQEALTNVIKHSGARHATLSAWSDGHSVSIRLTDDGAGPQPEHREGRGLANMRTRAQRLQGSVDVKFGKTGTEVLLRFPLAAASS
jgi:signal transduction histidine kinase